MPSCTLWWSNTLNTPTKATCEAAHTLKQRLLLRRHIPRHHLVQVAKHAKSKAHLLLLHQEM